MSVSCIIPAHNEGKRIVNVLSQITSSKYVNEIICVDDCSDDDTSSTIKKTFPSVKLLRLQQHSGKSRSVQQGLRFVRNPVVFLCDADLKDLNVLEIDRSIEKFLQLRADLIIFRRIHASAIVRLFRSELLISGERLLNRSDLAAIFKDEVSGYNLEVVMNHYMMRHKKSCFWSCSSARNTFKIEKYGLFMGFLKDARMYLDMFVLNAGFYKYNYGKQVLCFCKDKI